MVQLQRRKKIYAKSLKCKTFAAAAAVAVLSDSDNRFYYTDFEFESDLKPVVRAIIACF